MTSRNSECDGSSEMSHPEWVKFYDGQPLRLMSARNRGNRVFSAITEKAPYPTKYPYLCLLPSRVTGCGAVRCGGLDLTAHLANGAAMPRYRFETPNARKPLHSLHINLTSVLPVRYQTVHRSGGNHGHSVFTWFAPMTTFGAEIPASGQRPDWLDADEMVQVEKEIAYATRPSLTTFTADMTTLPSLSDASSTTVLVLGRP